MKFDVIKRDNKKKWIIGGIAAIGLISIGVFAGSYAKYQNVEDIKLVEGTINYKPYDFKMIAMYKSDDGTNYTEITGRMPSSGYVINEEKSYCTTDGVNKDTTAKLYTSNGEHIFKNLIKSDKCYVYFDNATTAKSVSELATKLSKIAKLEAPDFSVVATTNEGVYRTRDGMYGGYSYYWRGAATTNYVQFAGYCWRIIRINGDGTMRLIYDGATCHANGTSTTDSIAVASTAYNSNNNKSEYVGWKYTEGLQRPSSITSGTDTTIKTALESWYTTNITNKGYDGKVATGKFCNDRNVQSDSTWASAPSSTFYYAAYERRSNAAPTLSCATLDTYSLKVGLITADEVMYAGGNAANNTAYYLYNGQVYWIMSPYRWIAAFSEARVFIVNTNGSLGDGGVRITSSGVRPVINLASSTTFAAGGTGTQSNPYVVS